MSVTVNHLRNTPLQVGAHSTFRQTENVVGTHHIQAPGSTCGHILQPSAIAGAQKVEVRNTGANTVYLPYYQNEIASIILPKSGPRYFCTDNLSGCAFFVDKLPSGNLVVYHANSQLGSDRTTMEAHSVSYQAREAVAALGELYITARSAYRTSMPHKKLFKNEYLKNAHQAMMYRALTHEIPTFTGEYYLGGTTIIGFRHHRRWDFWYQNWMQVRGAVQVVFSTKFCSA